jgi:DegV family protein with EDD domain
LNFFALCCKIIPVRQKPFETQKGKKMKPYQITCCSTADLTQAQFENAEIAFVPFHFYLDGVHYYDDLGQSLPFAEFYQKMEEGAMTKTAQVNVDEYIAFWRPYLEKGMDIFHVTLSSGLSGTINSANIAKADLEAEFPDAKIYVVDSLGGSAGYGLLMTALAEKKAQGADIDELYAWAQENKLKVNHWFFSTDLTYFVRGGRISKASGWFGTLLKICPLLNVNTKGSLVPREKIRTKERVIRTIVDRMAENAQHGENYSGKCYITHAACYEDARKVADLIEARFPNLDGKVVINDIGTTIGSHTGPGTVALFFFGEGRDD